MKQIHFGNSYVVLLCLTAIHATACTCGFIPTGCIGLAEAETIVEVRVLEGNEISKMAKVVVEEAWRGPSKRQEILWVDSLPKSNCGLTLKSGQSWILFGERSQHDLKSVLQTGACKGNLELPRDEFQASTIRSILTGSQPRLIGSTGAYLSENESWIPLAGVRVRARKGKLVREALSDPMGNYEFRDIEPGVYELSLIRDGYASDSKRNRKTGNNIEDVAHEEGNAPSAIEVPSRSCAYKSLYLVPKR